MELWQDSCEEEVIQRCQAFLQQSLEINEVTRAVAKKIITVTMVKIMMMRVTVVMTTLVVYY